MDENSGQRSQVIIDDRDKVLQPHIDVLGSAGQRLAHYPLPTGAIVQVKDGAKVAAGEPLARIRRDISKTRDITGGLPRVAELFEARKPKDAASVTEIDGAVSFGGITRGMRKLIVTNDNGDTKEYLIPQGRHLHVQEGDTVRAGDRLTEGPINPHDILRIKGIKEAQEYLVEEIQEVYRLQGVRIDDKHIETVVRQMLQKVRIEDAGDSPLFLEGDQVDKVVLREENDRIEREGGQPATFTPLLLGITKASLSTQSLHLRGLLPGDHADSHRGRHPRQRGLSAGAQGERDHRQPHPRRHRSQQVPEAPGLRGERGGRGVPGAGSARPGARAPRGDADRLAGSGPPRRRASEYRWKSASGPSRRPLYAKNGLTVLGLRRRLVRLVPWDPWLVSSG